ncbi:MAG: MoaD/ThiS family protein [Nitrospinota bacterium]|nr:MoaD/ThiS family protein [Nitrospinota bacterium]MDH5757674.1 MoaD/ThiS family protein [Nitrospinota bacterium]
MPRIRFFASIQDKLGASELRIRITDSRSLRNILMETATINQIEPSFFIDGPFLFAINQTMAGLDDMVQDGDEIAIFPPMSGGL